MRLPCLDNVGQLQTPATQGNIDPGESWPADTALIGSTQISTVWVLEGGKKRGIPSGEVMDYYHFARSKVTLKTPAELGAIPDGPPIDPPTAPLALNPQLQVKGFPIVTDATSARGYAKLTVEQDGTVHLYMKVTCPLGFNPVTYVATVAIAGWHDQDPSSLLSPNIPVKSLTCNPPVPPLFPHFPQPVPDADKDQHWVLYIVKPEDLQRIRAVHVFIDKGSGDDLATTVIKTLQRAGDVWDAANTLYKKVKDSALGRDVATALVAAG